jgi:hypothetical protein
VVIDGPRPVQLQNSGDIYAELGPNYSSQELLVTAALRTAMIPGQELVATVRPPFNLEPFPPRYGYTPYPERQSDMRQVLDVDRTFPDARYELSGGVAGWQASARNVGVNDVW